MQGERQQHGIAQPAVLAVSRFKVVHRGSLSEYYRPVFHRPLASSGQYNPSVVPDVRVVAAVISRIQVGLVTLISVR